MYYIDTNATYAGNWLEGFFKKTLSNPKLFDKTLILITFDEVIVVTNIDFVILTYS